jgi:hypothetical protein
VGEANCRGGPSDEKDVIVSRRKTVIVIVGRRNTVVVSNKDEGVTIREKENDVVVLGELP